MYAEHNVAGNFKLRYMRESEPPYLASRVYFSFKNQKNLCEIPILLVQESTERICALFMIWELSSSRPELKVNPSLFAHNLCELWDLLHLHFWYFNSTRDFRLSNYCTYIKNCCSSFVFHVINLNREIKPTGLFVNRSTMILWTFSSCL